MYSSLALFLALLILTHAQKNGIHCNWISFRSKHAIPWKSRLKVGQIPAYKMVLFVQLQKFKSTDLELNFFVKKKTHTASHMPISVLCECAHHEIIWWVYASRNYIFFANTREHTQYHMWKQKKIILMLLKNSCNVCWKINKTLSKHFGNFD